MIKGTTSRQHKPASLLYTNTHTHTHTHAHTQTNALAFRALVGPCFPDFNAYSGPSSNTCQIFWAGLDECMSHACAQTSFKGKLHSKIISSDMIEFFSVESDGEGPRSKFEREDGQTDGGKLARVRICDVMVPHWCHLAIMARSRD